MVVNQGQLAEIFGVTDVTVWEWQKQGLPIQKQGPRGEANGYEPSEVIAWYVQRELAKAASVSQKDRLARLQGDKLELELAQQRGVLIPVDEIEPLWSSRVLTAAAFMASRHSRLAAILEAAAGVEAKREILKREDAEFLKKLGVDGGRMQIEVEKLLEKVSAEEAEAFLQRIRGDGEQRIAKRAQGGVGPSSPA